MRHSITHGRYGAPSSFPLSVLATVLTAVFCLSTCSAHADAKCRQTCRTDSGGNTYCKVVCR